ncbi:MAG TPA: ATP-binding cassette domain-containing protein [Acidobacteriaceae bacterium]|nr:ATP-binding cassette domain-containing protein [Acidobacteriaceae bacterium]
MALLEVQAISKSYPSSSGAALVVDQVSFTIARGETLGVVGESGSGKSTVARVVLGLIEPTAGEVRFDGAVVAQARGARLRWMRRRMQPVFQDPYAALNPRMRVEQILCEPFRIHSSLAGSEAHLPRGRKAQRERIAELLKSVGLDDSALPRYPHEFSGGQRQRINIARALALQPELLVLDEPVSALDVSVGAQIVNLLRTLQRGHGMAYLFITHSMPLVRYLADRIVVMQRGKVVEEGEADALCRAPREPYTQALIAATPQLPA